MPEKSSKKGVVLLATILLILLLMGIVSLFLNSSHKLQQHVKYIYALNETHLLSYSIAKYLKTIKLDEEGLFYASQSAIPLTLQNTQIMLSIDSAQNRINFFNYKEAMKKSSEYSSRFITYLGLNKVQNPVAFTALAKEFQGVDEHDLFDEYFLHTSQHLTTLQLKKTFTFEDEYAPLDINFLSYEQLLLLFYDANSFALKQIAQHLHIYKSFNELPFDKAYLTKLRLKQRLGHFTTKTSIISVDARIKSSYFSSHITLIYDLKKDTLLRYKLLGVKVTD